MITSRAAGQTILTALNHSGVRWAFLHGAQRWANGDLASDLDIAVDADAIQIARRMSAALAGKYVIVMCWQYDPWSWTTFWMDPDGHESVQLDLTSDPAGRNKYGIRTAALLDAAVGRYGYPSASAIDEQIYLLSKRLVKRDYAAAGAHATEVLESAERHERLQVVLSATAARRARAFIERGQEGRNSSHSFLVHGRRFCSRLLYPPGTVVQVDDRIADATLDQLASHFDGRVPFVRRTNHRLALMWWRLRPSLVFTRRVTLTDGRLSGDDSSEATLVSQTIHAMHEKVVHDLDRSAS